jgi:hypothetical protein
VEGHLLGLDPAAVADAAAAVFGGVGVEALAPAAGEGAADPVILARHGREVADDERDVARLAAAAQIGERALLPIGGVDPLEPLGLAVERMQRRQVAVEPVQIADEELDAAMHRVLEEVPVEAAVVVPLRALPELALWSRSPIGLLDYTKKLLREHVSQHLFHRGEIHLTGFMRRVREFERAKVRVSIVLDLLGYGRGAGEDRVELDAKYDV